MKRLLFLALTLTLSAFAKDELSKGKDMLYSARFEEAEKIFKKEKAKTPDSAAPSLYLTAAALGKLVMSGEEPALKESIEKSVEECCDASLKSLMGEPKPEDYLYAGVCFLLKASLEAKSERLSGSLIWAKRALTQIKKAKEFEETKTDAAMLDAAYNCVTASAPWPLPVCVGWFVLPDDPGESLAAIEELVSQGSRFEEEMRIFLIWEYCRRGYPRGASSHLKALKKTFPDSPFVDIMSIRTSLSSGNHKGALSLATNLYSRCSKRKAWRGLMPDAAFLAGAAYLTGGYTLGAESWLELAAKDGKNKPAVQAAAQLLLGQCADQRGEREEALRRYALVHVIKGANPLLKSYAAKLQKKASDPRNVIY